MSTGCSVLNGAGKTTLLSAMFGLVLPDEGTLRLFGRTRAEAGAQWLDGVGGFVETPRFYPYLSGRRNLAVLAGLDGGDAATLIDDALKRVGLSGAVTRRKVRGYSQAALGGYTSQVFLLNGWDHLLASTPISHSNRQADSLSRPNSGTRQPSSTCS